MSDSHTHHIVPIKTYVLVLVVLLALMGLTIFVAEHPTSNTFVNNIIALSIAVIKASLVVAIFMGVKFGTKLIKLWAYTGFVWMTLMFVVYCDYVARGWEQIPGWEQKVDALPRGAYKAPAAEVEATEQASHE